LVPVVVQALQVPILYLGSILLLEAAEVLLPVEMVVQAAVEGVGARHLAAVLETLHQHLHLKVITEALDLVVVFFMALEVVEVLEPLAQMVLLLMVVMVVLERLLQSQVHQ
jgi:hypothetical protein